MTNERSRQRGTVVAVVRSEATARTVADAARAAGAVNVRVGTRDAEVASLRGEMHEEMQHTIVGPGNVGPFTKEMSKGVVRWVIVGTTLGALVTLPAGFIEFGSLPLLARLAIAAVAGAFGGATAGFVIGGSAKPHAKGTGEMAAERGVVVSADADDPEVLEAIRRRLTEADVIRVDVLDAAGNPVGLATTEEQRRRPA